MDTEYQTYDMSTYGGYGGGEDAAFLAALAFLGLFGLLVGLAVYAINAIFLMKILKNAGHKNPVAAAWVPIWNTASLMEVGGIKQPWIWTAIIFGGSFLGSLIPGVGFIVSLAVFVVTVIVTIWLAKGLQAALRTGGTGGIVLAVLLPVVWVIWMGVVSGRERYDRSAALREGGTMPMNWFGDGDRNGSFPNEPSYAQPAQSGFQTAPEPQQYQAPQQPAAGAWSAPASAPWVADQDGGAKDPVRENAQPQSPVVWGQPTPQPPVAPAAAPTEETEQRDDELPELPPTPRYEAPPREPGAGDGNRTV